MILVGLGANLPGPGHTRPRETLEAALGALACRGVAIAARSRWYSSAPVPASDQPRYVNGVVAVETALDPAALLAVLHEVEAAFGRKRGAPNAARALDLDLLAYDEVVQEGPPALPHPRMHTRAFVLMPLLDVAPGWRHPVGGASARDLLSRAGDRADVRPMRAATP